MFKEVNGIEEEQKLERPRREFPRETVPEEEEVLAGGTIVAQNLSPQLGTDAKDLAKGGVDMRRLSVIDNKLQAAIAYFSWRGKKVRFWNHIVEQYLNTSPSIGGLGRRQLIQMQSASSGIQPTEEVEKPGWLARNITNRSWRERETYERPV